jgi:hypothetical protein
MNPTSPTSAMSQGATFMRPGAMAWGRPGRASQPPADPATPVTIEHALAAAAKDPDRVTDLLDELSRGRLWLPLPDARPVTDGSAVLPTVTYLGAEFVPAFTSAGRLAIWLGRDPVPPFAAMPHIVVPAAELARRMPPGCRSPARARAWSSRSPSTTRPARTPTGRSWTRSSGPWRPCRPRDFRSTSRSPARTSRTRSTPGSRRTPSPSTSGPRLPSTA